jgi:hypothetical protein
MKENTKSNNKRFDQSKQSVNRVTFNCTLCNGRNYDRKGYIAHVEQMHRHDQGVCAICKCQPWGDPNYVTYLHGHLMKRHLFDYDTTVDYNEDEDEVLRRVLQQSLNDK